MRQILFDKFIIPKDAKNKFLDRMNISRNFIKKLPGFIQDSAYERTDEAGNLICVTIAIWENEEVLKSAKEIVQMEYKKQGFNLSAMLEELGITIERAIFTEMQPFEQE